MFTCNFTSRTGTRVDLDIVNGYVSKIIRPPTGPEDDSSG